MKKLLVLGSSNIDHIAQMAAFPKPGETLHGKAYSQAYGGKGANQAVAARKQGADVQFVSAVGNDAVGAEMLAYFAALGMDVSAVARVSEATGMAMIWVSDAGENSIVVVAGANAALDKAAVNAHEQAIAVADMLLMQLETPLDGVLRAAQIAREHGVPVMLNPAPATDLPDELLACIDILTPNESEAQALTGVVVRDEASAAQAAQILHDKGIETVLITMGARGVHASTNGKGQLYPAFVVKARDTTAAGDTFNGALAAALLHGDDWDSAIRYAQAAAALSVQSLGAQPSIPARERVLAFLAEHVQTGNRSS